MRATNPNGWDRSANPSIAVKLVKKCHLVDFAKCCESGPDLLQSRVAEKHHAQILGGTFDFRGRTPLDDHFANVIGKIQKLGDGRAAPVSAAGTLQASGSFTELNPAPFSRVKTGFPQYGGIVANPFLAALANDANQTLRHDAIECRNEVIGLDSHVDKPADYIGHVVCVNGGEDQVAGKG